jgi:hypothetical protein
MTSFMEKVLVFIQNKYIFVELEKDLQVELLKSEPSYDLFNGHCTILVFIQNKIL